MKNTNASNLLINTANTANIIIMLLLAVWQLQRAHHKYELLQRKPQDVIHSQSLKAHLPLQDNQAIHFHLTIDKAHYFIIDPAIYKHQVGVEVIATSFSEQLQQYVIIHLGWQPTFKSAQERIQTYNSKEGVTGILYRPRGRLLHYGPVDNHWPRKLSFLDIPTISQSLPAKTMSHIVVTNGSALHDQLSQDHALHLGIVRHICYALQFIAFGMLGAYYCARLRAKRN